MQVRALSSALPAPWFKALLYIIPQKNPAGPGWEANPSGSRRDRETELPIVFQGPGGAASGHWHRRRRIGCFGGSRAAAEGAVQFASIAAQMPTITARTAMTGKAKFHRPNISWNLPDRLGLPKRTSLQHLRKTQPRETHQHARGAESRTALSDAPEVQMLRDVLEFLEAPGDAPRARSGPAMMLAR